jgi:hypothetical protein
MKKMKRSRQQSIVPSAGLRWNIRFAGDGEQKKQRFRRAPMKEIEQNSQKLAIIEYGWTIRFDARIRDAERP